MKRSILLVRRAYGLGGAELYNLNLAQELQRLGYRAIICTQQPELKALAQEDGITVINPIWLDNHHNAARSIPPKLKYVLLGPIIVIQYLYYLLRYNIASLYIQTRDDQIFGTIAARILGRRAIWADHGDMKHTLTRMNSSFLRLYRYALGLSHAVVCVAKKEEANIAAVLPPALRYKLVVIHNGVSRALFEAPPKETSGRPLIIGSTARVQHEKGLDYLIKGFAEALPDLPPETKLRLAGVVDHQDLVELAKGLELGDKIVFEGGLTNAEIASFIDQLDIYVFPSLAEVFPLSILEAMMASRTIVATNVGGIPEQIENKVSGLLVDPKSSQQIAEALVSLATHAKDRRRYAEAAHAKAVRDFDFAVIVKERILPLLVGVKS